MPSDESIPAYGRPSCTACNGRGVVGGAQRCVRCEDVVEQCRDWLLLKCEAPRRAAADQQDSHSVVFGAACVIVQGFQLSGPLAQALLHEYLNRSDLPWTDREVDHKLRSAERVGGKEPGYLIWTRGHAGAQHAQAVPKWEEFQRQQKHLSTKALVFDAAALKNVQGVTVAVDENFLRERSVMDPRRATAEVFLEALYKRDERVLVFTKFTSQGDFAYVPREGWWKLGNGPGEERVKVVEVEREWRLGVWFLAQPVSGGWKCSAGRGEKRQTRRSEVNVTAFRYMVVESDIEGIEQQWLNLLGQLPLPIVALYTSGGRSVHALLRVNAETKPDWDAWKDALRPLLTKFGADKGVFSAVRLTRLPTFFRAGTQGHDGLYVRYEVPREQKLLYLNPNNWGRLLQPICLQRRLRGLEDSGGVA